MCVEGDEVFVFWEGIFGEDWCEKVFYATSAGSGMFFERRGECSGARRFRNFYGFGRVGFENSPRFSNFTGRESEKAVR